MNYIAVVHDDHHPLLDQVAAMIESHGAKCALVPWTNLMFEISPTGVSCTSLATFDAVFLDRVGERFRSYHTQLDLLALSDAARRTVNDPTSYRVARDKALAQHAMVRAGLPVPEARVTTGSASAVVGLAEAVALKSTLGVCAEEVWLGPAAEALSHLDSILRHDGMALVQSGVDNPTRSIWRVDVVDGVAVTVNQRYAATADGPPLVNGSHGGKVEFHDPQDASVAAQVALAIEASTAMRLAVSGVDMIETADGSLMLLETNPEPDATDHPDLTDVLPEAIADLLLRTATRAR